MNRFVQVLYVDEDVDGANLAAACLEGVDDRLEVTIATSGRDALDRLDAEEFDCVVSVYDLPETDGIELLERVREDHRILPFILFTGTGSETVASEAISAGVTDYLQRDSSTEQFERVAERITDVVASYRAEQRDVESREYDREPTSLLQNIIEQVPIHLYVKDEAAQHLWVSSYYLDDTDELPDVEEHIGQTDLDLYPDAFAAESYEDDLQVIETGEPIVDRVAYEPASGEWQLTSKVPWRDQDDEVVGLIGVSRRITKRKEYEQQLERQNERLDEFVSFVSHDLRNPLTVAQGHLQTAQEQCDSPHLAEIGTSLDRMEALIDELLALARQGEQAIDPAPVSLPALVHSCWENVATADAALELATDSVIWADHGRLRQLFENTFRNAVEHAGPDVTVTVGDLEDGFYVEDDGPGIPADERDTVFERGYSTAQTGTGFGLPIVEKTVDTHDWSVRVAESDAGGARFEITGVESGS